MPTHHINALAGSQFKENFRFPVGVLAHHAMRSLEWLKPEPVGNMGLVYLSKCRSFMIIRASATKFRLAYLKPGHERISLGEFPQLRDAKDAASTKRDSL